MSHPPIGHYTILSELGRGGMGVVYLADDTRLERKVAIKALPAALTSNPVALARFRAEARTVAQLNHPHIAQIHHLLEDDGAMYLVLEYVPGKSLTDRIKAGLDQNLACRLAVQIARALEAAHDKGVVHRDLKPDNVRVTDEDTAKVLDFGIALALPMQNPDVTAPTVIDIHARGGVAGTPGYMAPEQCRAEDVDARADIFAFGCILYEMLAARRAFTGTSTAELIAATLRDQPDFTPLAACPQPVGALVRRCLARRPDDRPQTAAEARKVLEQSLGLDTPAPTRPPATISAPSTNLPRQFDRFVGREDEIQALADALAQRPLVTLTGSGGCGKTRLAIEFARTRLHHFSGGVWLAELAQTTDPALVPSTVAAALQVKDQANKTTTQRLAETLSQGTSLLILDNCEHVLRAAGQLAEALLHECPDLRIIATSREPLAIRPEHAHRLPNLHVPDTDEATDDCESVALFLERAREARPGFDITDANAPSIASICRRLDGIPLAIELAAARIRMLGPDQIDRHLDDRFKLLRAGRAGFERHQTLRAAIDWSYRLLSDVQRHALTRVSVCAGSFDLDAAHALVGEASDLFETLDILTTLADKSLLLAEQSDRDTRYRLLETVRQYALDELERHATLAETRDRHMSHYAALVAEARPQLAGPDQTTWLDRLEREADNILAAIEHGAQAHPEVAQRICGDAWLFWLVRAYLRQGVQACTRALSAGHEPTRARADALNTAGSLSWSMGDFAASRRFHEEALDIRRRLDDKRGIAGSLNSLGSVAVGEGNRDEARRQWQESLDIMRAINDRRGTAGMLNNLGNLERADAHLQRAEQLQAEALDIMRSLNDKRGIANALGNLAIIARSTGNLRAAAQRFQESLVLFDELGDKRGIAESLDQASILAAAAQDHLTAATLAGAADALLERIGAARETDTAALIDSYLPPSKAALHESTGSHDAWTRAEIKGRSMSERDAIAHARSSLSTPVAPRGSAS